MLCIDRQSRRRLKLRAQATIAALTLFLSTLSSTSAPTPDSQDLFLSGQGGYHTYRIPSLIVSSNGTLLAFCEGRKNSASDSGDIDLLLKRSTDGGRTWGPTQVIWDDGNNTCGNPCPVLDQQTGTLWLLLTRNPGSINEAAITRTERAARTVWISKSDDHGKTWSQPAEITSAVKDPDWGWYATGPGIGIQIQHGPHRGRLIVPCDHSYDRPPTEGSPATDGGSHIIYSDDHGRTWRRGGHARPNLNECQVAELADGRGTLLLNMRNYARETRRAHATSMDGGLTWSPPEPQPELIEPRCQASLLRFSWPQGNAPGCLLFANPAALRRTNLTIRASYDDGKTWPVFKTVHAGPSAYSCLAALPDGTIGLLYERGTTNAYQKITFASISPAWLQAKTDDETWSLKHRLAVERRRRLIFNNDGNEPVYYCKAATAEALLEPRTAALAGSQVDSIFYCTWSSGFGLFTHDTKVGQVFDTREEMFKDNRTRELLDRGIDPLQVMIDFAHSNQMELFWSMRMNDTHDGARAAYGPVMFRANRLKQDHPEWLIGSKEKPPRHGAWSAVDYGVSEVRELAFRYCEEVCQNYAVDGIELDFFRHAFLFRCSGRGEACGPAELNALSDLLRRIRSLTQLAGRRRERPLLLAIRVPDSIEYCRHLGIDLETWLKEGLVDLLIVSGYTQLNPWEYSVALGKKYGVKVYPSLDEPRVRDEVSQRLRQSIATYRGRALNAWAAGMDGIYLFNFFDPQSSLWRELGQPTDARRLERNHFVSVRGAGSMPVPHQKFLRVPTLNPGQPLAITAGQPARVPLRVGEDLSSLRPNLKLRLRIEPLDTDLQVALNGKMLTPGTANAGWIEFAPDPSSLVENNQLVVAIPNQDSKPVTLLDAYLNVAPAKD